MKVTSRKAYSQIRENVKEGILWLIQIIYFLFIKPYIILIYGVNPWCIYILTASDQYDSIIQHIPWYKCNQLATFTKLTFSFSNMQNPETQRNQPPPGSPICISLPLSLSLSNNHACTYSDKHCLLAWWIWR
jgi:hypothetical protein